MNDFTKPTARSSDPWSRMSSPAPLDGEASRPALSETRYDRVTSFLMALVLVTVLVVFWLSMLFISNQVWPSHAVADVEIIEVAGGDPQGVPGAIRAVGDPSLPEVENPSTVDRPGEDYGVEEQVAQWMDALSDLPADVVNPQPFPDESSRGERGYSKGNSPFQGRGIGGGPGSGLPREQRWVIYYPSGQSLREYAGQLDFFGIELGTIVENRLIYVSRLSDDAPQRRTGAPGDDQRIRWLWRGGNRRQADTALLKKVGIAPEQAKIIMQFLPRDVEEELARLERSHANRPPHEVSRTAFKIRSVDQRYEFYVVEQDYFEK